jgi:hypothetical protein
MSYVVTSSGPGSATVTVTTPTATAIVGGASAQAVISDVLSGAVPPLLLATLWLEAARSTANEQLAKNWGAGGSALDARYGTTTGTDSTDPILLIHTGTNYLYLPGVASNYAYTNHTSILMVSGDIELLARIAPTSWQPATAASVISKGTGYQLGLASTGLTFTVNGTTVAATVAPSFTAGSIGWVRATRSASTGTVTFYTAADSNSEPSTWTQLGSTVATTAGTITANTTTLNVGADPAGTSPMTGQVYRIIVKAGSTAVFDADMTSGLLAGNQISMIATTGQTVSILRGSGLRPVAVCRQTWLLADNRHLSIPDDATLNASTTSTFTALAVVRQYATPTSSGRYLDKSAASNDTGWSIQSDGTTLGLTTVIDDGPTTASSSSAVALSSGGMSVVGVIIDRANNQMKSFVNSTISSPVSLTGVGSATNALRLTVGASPAVANGQQFELFAVAVFNRALSVSELTNIASYYSEFTGRVYFTLSDSTFGVLDSNQLGPVAGSFNRGRWVTLGGQSPAAADLNVVQTQLVLRFADQATAEAALSDRQAGWPVYLESLRQVKVWSGTDWRRW